MFARLARSGVWGFLFLALLWTAVAWPWLSGSVTIPYDAKAHFQAQLQFLANALHRGDSPFWTPNIFGGSPQIADPQSLIFSPAFLLALVDATPSFRAMDVYVLGLLLFGAFAVAQHGRERGWTGAAQVIAGLVFAFGASSAWRLQHVGQVQSLACLAVAFWLLARALEHRSWRSGLGAGAAAGLMLATPDQIAYLGVLLLGAYVVWFMLREGRPFTELRRSVPALLSGAIAGAAIVALPLAMTMMFAEASSRPEIDFSEVGRGSLHPAFLLTALIGDLFGAADPKVEYWGPSSGFWAPGSLSLSQNMGQVYVGALPVLAVAAWLLSSWRSVGGEARFLVFALIGAVVYALGWYTPVFALLYDWLPGVALFRRPADATFLIGLLLALLSGHAVTGLMAANGGRPLARIGAVIAALCALALATGLALAASHGVLKQAAPLVALAGLWLGVGALGVALLIRARSLPRGAAAMLAALVCGAVATDLRFNNGPNESTALRPELYAVMEPDTANDTISYLKALTRRAGAEPARRDRIEFVGMAFHWPNLGMIHGFDHAMGYNPLHLAEFTEAMGAQDHMGTAAARSFTPLYPSFRSTFADMLGLRYVVSSAPIERVDRSLKPGDMRLLARTGDGFVYENPGALPRAMFVSAWQVADFDVIRENGLPAGFDPRATVLIERAIEDTPFVQPDAERCARTKLRIVSYANTEVVIEVDAKTAGFVVLNDVWHPWWRVFVNGEEADVVKANVLFRAVQVEPGLNTIRFRFQPLDGLIAQLRERVLGPEEDEDAAGRTP